MKHSPSSLSLPRNVPVDGNWFDPERVQVTVTGRSTENAALQRMVYGDQLAATYATVYQNGQIVDDKHMLMCSRCHAWKPDAAFARDSKLMLSRRGRHYYCKNCRSKSALFQRLEMDEATESRLIAGSKRRKKR